MLRVVNLRDYRLKQEEMLVKVDRSSVLGNPFRMKDDSLQERNRVCEEYIEYFNRKVKEPGAFRDEVIRIFRMARDGQDIALGCWCAPERCHADYIKKFLENHICPGDCFSCKAASFEDDEWSFIGCRIYCRLFKRYA